MELEPTTLSGVVRLIRDVLREDYDLDAGPLIRAAGIDEERAEVVGSRISRHAVMRLWELAIEETGDRNIGLRVGSRVRPTSFHALGIAFLTCDNLRHALEALVFFYRVIVTVPLHLKLTDVDDHVELHIRYTNPKYPLPEVPFDSFIASIVELCRLATKQEFSPTGLRLRFADNGRAAAYEEYFNAPVVFDPDAEHSAVLFSRESLETMLPGRNVEILDATDRILEDYVAALNPDEISSQVRKLLLTMLPTGQASQEAIARKLHMSRSTLQRRLSEENTNYRELLEGTRKTLAIQYVRASEHPLSYIAFLLGFSDQSNFSRAFRRWTGVSPKAYQER